MKVAQYEVLGIDAKEISVPADDRDVWFLVFLMPPQRPPQSRQAIECDRKRSGRTAAGARGRRTRKTRAVRSIGHNSRKLLSLIYPAANRGSPWNHVYLTFFVVVRFKRRMQMIRSALSKFENGINAR
jgi:hypothetical protein